MDTLRDTLCRVMNEYAGEGFNSTAYLTWDAAQQFYVVASIATFDKKRFVSADLAVRLVDETIVIEHDMNNKPLVDALVQAGVPREKIVLAYAGEKLPA